MALITPSGLISKITGKIGGTVFQRSKSGLIARNNTTPVNNRSRLHNVSQGISFRCLHAWMALTDAQRSVWESFVQYLPVAEKNNSEKKISAQQTFIKYNSYRLHYGHALLISPLFDKGLITPIDLTIKSGFPFLYVSCDRTPIPADEFIILFCTIVFPPSVNNPGTRYKLMKTPTQSADVFDFAPYYYLVFGRVPVAGETIFIKYTNASLASGYFFPFKYKKVLLAP